MLEAVTSIQEVSERVGYAVNFFRSFSSAHGHDAGGISRALLVRALRPASLRWAVWTGHHAVRKCRLGRPVEHLVEER
jgi:hypothetical protein